MRINQSAAIAGRRYHLSLLAILVGSLGLAACQPQQSHEPPKVANQASEAQFPEVETEVLPSKDPGQDIANAVTHAQAQKLAVSAAASPRTLYKPSVQPRSLSVPSELTLADVNYPSATVLANGSEVYIANGIMVAGETPLSTFSVDVDSGSYSLMRRSINLGTLPPKGTVRVEELINYFDYNYPQPDKSEPFSVSTELAPSPYNEGKMLLRIGLKGYDVPASQIGAANLVFLLDVSGSMSSQDKLPLLKSAIKMLSDTLTSQDKVSIVVYAGEAAGGTNGGEGIQTAYRLARKHFISGGVNRVLLATDGDFNVGLTSRQELLALVEQQKQQGIGLTTLGFGLGNYRDSMLEQLADKGNGQYAYIDTLNEARKILVEQRSGTLLTIASDVKVQLEFNPALVAEYRLIGYENRALKREDFNNDKVDAAEMAAGHVVTALYELSLTNSNNLANDALRYGRDPVSGKEKYSREELGYLKLRAKPPLSDSSKDSKSQLYTHAIRLDSAQKSLALASDDLRFAAAVAGLGQLLNGSVYLHGFDWRQVAELADSAKGEDPYGYRHEFVSLARSAALLAEQGALKPGRKTVADKLSAEPMSEPMLELMPAAGFKPLE
ncbi:vWA domain-containing protein [Shewanella algae]|uniref:vWA domain-containing protein n=1 Tax=Shewanella algae TaxID=38313 RepID=UPI001183DF1C|nr:von Willebrand factor type A domain-containing protein [Shewanella algae]